MRKENLLKSGDWIALTDAGIIFYSILQDGVYSFPSKKELLKDLSGCKMDARRIPKIKRVTAGEYIYIPKDFCTGDDGDEITLVKINNQNIEYYEQMIREAEEQDES